MIDFGDIWELLKVTAREGGIAAIHAEDNDIVMHMYDKLTKQGRTGFEHMSEVHNTLSEDLSFRRVIRLAEEERTAQARRVAELFAAQPLPVLLAGDLNSRPGTPPMRVFRDKWQLPEKPAGQLTFPATKPRQDIDHIFLPRGAPLQLVEYTVIDEPIASDHRPVLAVFAWRE